MRSRAPRSVGSMSDSARRLARAVAAALCFLASGASAGDASWRGTSAPAADDAGYTRRSFYVEMRDGVPIAVDLYLPRAAAQDARLPAILRQTRYWRAPRFRAAWRPLLDEPHELTRRFLARGLRLGRRRRARLGCVGRRADLALVRRRSG